MPLKQRKRPLINTTHTNKTSINFPSLALSSPSFLNGSYRSTFASRQMNYNLMAALNFFIESSCPLDFFIVGKIFFIQRVFFNISVCFLLLNSLKSASHTHNTNKKYLSLLLFSLLFGGLGTEFISHSLHRTNAAFRFLKLSQCTSVLIVYVNILPFHSKT
jgi:hypothetical protein